MDNSGKPNAARGHRRSGRGYFMSKPQGIFMSKRIYISYYIDNDGIIFVRTDNSFDNWSVVSNLGGYTLNS